MAVIINAKNFETEVAQSSLPVVIDVYAPWCGPCRMMMPLFDELSQELTGQYKLCKINIDEERDLAIKFNVSSIPTFLFFKNGALIAKETGGMNKDGLLKKIEGHLK